MDAAVTHEPLVFRFFFGYKAIATRRTRIMHEAVRVSEWAFEDVAMTVEKGCRLRLAGVLKARATLEEVTFLSEPVAWGGERRMHHVRAFRAHGHRLDHDGVRDGDYLLVEPTNVLRSGSIVLAEVGGQPALARLSRRNDGTLVLTSSVRDTLPLANTAHASRIVGVFVGILRKRGFGGSGARLSNAETRPVAVASAVDPHCERSPAVRRMITKPPGKFTVLRSQLGMLESTYAATDNPRLQRALRNEAQRVRRALQHEVIRRRRRITNKPA